MIECKECKKQYSPEECLIVEGKVLCIRCSLDLIIAKLERINGICHAILNRLSNAFMEG